MRPEPNLRVEPYRRRDPPSDAGASWGFFVVPRATGDLKIISSGSCQNNPHSLGWEHVSVSLVDRVPTWDELSFVKELFWRDDETVVHFIPRKDQYVNAHPHVMHLWKRGDSDYELPPRGLLA